MKLKTDADVESQVSKIEPWGTPAITRATRSVPTANTHPGA